MRTEPETANREKGLALALCGVFFLSGASALIFEALWFRLSGIVLGNSVWASAVVLAAFMAGLALGSGWISLRGHRLSSPLAFYAALEVSIGLSGLAIVLLLPHLTGLLLPAWRALAGSPILMNALRAGVALVLMLVPATAMGATLPLLVRALGGERGTFGSSLGLLYGWNTLGATAGVLLTEVLLTRWFGLRGSGLLAGGLNLIVAAVAFRLAKAGSGHRPPAPESAGHSRAITPRARRLLGAGFLCGLILLALEVVWTRFLVLFFVPIGMNFAVMLAVVLVGIGGGGLVAARLTASARPGYSLLVPTLAAAGIAAVLTYGNASAVLKLAPAASETTRLLMTAGFLMLPVSFLSGLAFVLLGDALQREIPSPTRAAGLLTLVNTVGGAAGSLLAGFGLIPYAGIERTFFLLAAGYALAALLAGFRAALPPPGGFRGTLVPAALVVAVLGLFPFGSMQLRYLARSIAPFVQSQGEKRVAFREGVSETIQYLEKGLYGEPYYHRLVTNSYSMSATTLQSRRYMKHFVYLPVALRPDLESALLICFGCGATAKALTDTPGLQRIEIVDISREIVEMSRVVYPDSRDNPIHDPRVRVHIEDGRFFLQNGGPRFDLITAEPPPPRGSGVVNLYTREFFQLIRNRLTTGGIVTYWLPVGTITLPEAQAILRGFCDVFPECSLWSGSGFEWAMLGVNGRPPPVTEADFRRQWRDPKVGAEMRDLGFARPEEFGALFLADGPRLRRWLGTTLPLTDDHPQRLSTAFGSPLAYRAPFLDLMKPEACRENFLASPGVGAWWPEALRAAAAASFTAQALVNELLDQRLPATVPRLERLHRCLHEPLLEPYIPWALGSDALAERILSRHEDQRVPGPDRLSVLKHRAAAAVRRRDYALAEDLYRQVSDYLAGQPTRDPAGVDVQRSGLGLYRIYLLALADRRDRAAAMGREFIELCGDGRPQCEAQLTKVDAWLDRVLKDRAATAPRTAP